MSSILIGYIMSGKAGGVDMYLMSILQPLSQKFSVTVLTSKKDAELDNKMKELGVELIEVPRLTHPFLQFAAIRNLVNSKKFDIAYLNTSTAFNLPFMIACHKYCSSCIVHSHSSGIDCNNRFKVFWLKLAQRICKYILFLFTDQYYACSFEAAKWMFPLKKSLIKKKVKIIPNMRDFKKYAFIPRVKNEIKHQLNIENKIVLGHIGNFQPVKNVGFIIDVMKALCDISDKYCLIFIGDGPEKNSAIRKVRDLKLEQNVIFLPYQKQVEKYYQVMDYFLLPSFFEGLPLVGIEAQAAGVYTLFSDRITREVRISNGCSFLPITRGVENWVNVITQKKWKREDWSLNKWAKNYDSNNHKNIIDELF